MTGRRLLAAALLVVGASTLVACGGEDDDARDDAGPGETRTAGDGEVFNDADVRFATEMIPHHAEAVQMVVLTRDRPLDPAVQRLADAIRDAQVLEVETMSDWLVAWDEEVPETSLDHSNAGHDSDGAHADGAPDHVVELADATDEEFQDLWLELMVEHHTGAVELAEAEVADGVHPGATALAETIVSTQTAEISAMEDLLEE